MNPEHKSDRILHNDKKIDEHGRKRNAKNRDRRRERKKETLKKKSVACVMSESKKKRNVF